MDDATGKTEQNKLITSRCLRRQYNNSRVKYSYPLSHFALLGYVRRHSAPVFRIVRRPEETQQPVTTGVHLPQMVRPNHKHQQSKLPKTLRSFTAMTQTMRSSSVFSWMCADSRGHGHLPSSLNVGPPASHPEHLTKYYESIMICCSSTDSS